MSVANEQSRLYGSNGEGKNGGVQLFDLDKMRASVKYASLLDYHATGKDGRRIGFLGDQTLYSFLFSTNPDVFYTLPCEWNRQLSMHFGFHNSTVHACPRRCGILHANYMPFKCIAWMMQKNPSCSSWKAMADQLGQPLSASHTCPRAAMKTRRDFQPALLSYFADCCVPDAHYADAHGSPTLAEADLVKAKGIKAMQSSMSRHRAKMPKIKG